MKGVFTFKNYYVILQKETGKRVWFTAPTADTRELIILNTDEINRVNIYVVQNKKAPLTRDGHYGIIL